MLIDVRSPSEYAKGHIPGAHNLPLLDDQERAEVGTLYKQVGQQQAIACGMERIAPKTEKLIGEAKTLANGGPLTIYCWRGGMRSSMVAQTLQTTGVECQTIEGGYKAFRRRTLETFAESRQLRILGGRTGAGKTAILHALRARGAQVVDLEGLANHRGSSYGQRDGQPTQEHFENLVAAALEKTDEGPIWIEDESRMIGRLNIPGPLFEQMATAPIYVVERPFEERAEELERLYRHHPALAEATERLRKRLGGERTDRALALLAAGELRAAGEIVLAYYDKTYTYSLSRKSCAITYLQGEGRTNEKWAEVLDDR